MKSLFLSLLSLALWAQAPQAFSHLGQEIEDERPFYLSLLTHKKFSQHQDEIDNYLLRVDEAFKLGYALDVEIASDEGKQEKELQSSYLYALRALQEPRQKVQKLYYQELRASMFHQDDAYFVFLINSAQPLLNKNSKLTAEVLVYARGDKKLQNNHIVQDLKSEKELDEFSYAYTQKMHQEYKAYQEVLKKAEALKLRKLLVSKKEGGVIVYAQENKNDIDFYMENLFEMHVSATLFIKDIKGYESTKALPSKLVLQAKEKRKVLSLKNTDKKKRVGYFSSHVSWSKGSVDARPDRDFVYALPFHESQRVSQGFNGNTSHKGNAKYAIDFAMDIGTPVYAARGGKVVEIVQRHNKHGMGKEMRQYANYVIVEHTDKTLGRYFHLKQNSVQVKLAQEIKKGELLALSGNTGRTSGPHLHFVVTKAKAVRDEYKSMSIPIRFLCSEGILDNPAQGAHYCSALK